MKNTELLKTSRDLLLALHKSLVDFERSIHEGTHGKVTSGQFLNLLLEDPQFAWLRLFSTLIVDIDEMFAQKDGFEAEAVEVHLLKLRTIISFEEDDDEFNAKYRSALQQDPDAAGRHGELRRLLT
jgi:hypothetical protein